jgi:hypothetical protein
MKGCLSRKIQKESRRSGGDRFRIVHIEKTVICRGTDNISPSGNVYLELTIFICRSCIATRRPLRLDAYPSFWQLVASPQHPMNNAAAARCFDRGDFGQRLISSPERTRVATAVEFPQCVVVRRIGQEKQVVSPWNPTKCGAATAIFFIHAYGSGDLASQGTFHSQRVNEGRRGYGVVFVSSNQRGLDYELAGKILPAHKAGLGSTAKRHSWKRQKQRNSHAQQAEAASHRLNVSCLAWVSQVLP